MWEWLRRQKQKQDAPLVGAPEVRRRKSYSADSGYVYQYYFEGYRVAVRGEAAGAQYVFNVSADRRNSFPLSIFIADYCFAEWEQSHGRDLDSTERYAVAKMALFQSFDERQTPAEARNEFRLRPADLEHITEMLDLD